MSNLIRRKINFSNVLLWGVVSALKVKAPQTLETLVTTHLMTQHHILEDFDHY